MYKEVTKNYLQSSSIRGFPRIVKAQNWSSKILWIVIVLVFTFIAVWQVSEVVAGYLKYEVQLEYHSRSDPTASFPSITICNQQPFAADPSPEFASRGFHEFVNRVNRLEYSLKNRSLSMLRNIATFYQNSRVMQIDGIAHLAGSLIRDCILELVQDNHVYHEPCLENNIQKFPHPRYFRCYTIKFTANATQRAHLRSVRLVTYLDNFNYPFFSRDLLDNDPDAVRKGLRVSVHPSGSLPQLDDNFVDVPPGASATLQVSTMKRRLKPKPYGTCKPHQHDRIVASSPLEESLSYAYTQHACQRMCLQQMLINRCRCVDPLLPVPRDIGIFDGASEIGSAGEAPLARARRSVEVVEEQKQKGKNASKLPNLAAALPTATVAPPTTTAAPVKAAAAAAAAAAATEPAMIQLVPYCRKWPSNFSRVDEAITAMYDRIKCAESERDRATQLKSCWVGSRNLSCYQPCNFTEHSVSTSYAGWPQESFHLAIYDKYIRSSPSRKYFEEYERMMAMMDGSKLEEGFISVSESKRQQLYNALADAKLLRENFIELMVVKTSWNVTEISEVPSFPLTRLLGAIGGTMNLWSGITIIAVIEFLELLAILAGTFVSNNCHGNSIATDSCRQSADSNGNDIDDANDDSVGRSDCMKQPLDEKSDKMPTDSYGSLYSWSGK